ncbi:MAG: prepilin-type N-terminal cleavage/methylation domain-containing protein [Armatimonadetes bacterium]|nr:prepilin-type N-terminal cleavage/methylation domain-containing protein [Armatimonadota bacterium]MBS1727331.1 prepilin-type N-terminal cleavage/methylation domain-containing protein [Armatimonadota bacterium]
MDRNHLRTRGFTLIELLVVIAIIAILAAILFPVFAQAKAAAKKAVCLSEVKQIAMAHLLYVSDYDDMACFSVNILATDTEFHLQDWYVDAYYTLPNFDGPFFSSQNGLLYPYMKNQQIYGCPDATGYLANAGVAPEYPNGHGVNANVMVFELTGWGYPPSPSVSMTSVVAPAETILVADAVAVNTSAPILTYQTWIQNPSEVGPQTWGLHNKQANVSWVDGHAKSMPVTVSNRLSDYFNNSTLMKNCQQYNVGSIINPKYPLGDPWMDYYYAIDKPN